MTSGYYEHGQPQRQKAILNSLQDVRAFAEDIVLHYQVDAPFDEDAASRLAERKRSWLKGRVLAMTSEGLLIGDEVKQASALAIASVPELERMLSLA